MIAKNIVLESPGTHFMHMRVKYENIKYVTEIQLYLFLFNPIQDGWRDKESPLPLFPL